MNMITATLDRPTFRLIPAKDAQAFIHDRTTAAFGNTKADDIIAKAERRADDIIAFASVEADRIIASAKARKEALEKRIENGATEIAERATQKLEAKQKALEAQSAMAQITAIAADYAALESWITETLMTALRHVIADMAPPDRCIGMIRVALAKTKERWDLSLSCHPQDYDMLLAAVAQGEFEAAISKVQRDPSIAPGTFYLKSEKDHFELNIEAELAALHEHIEASLGAATPTDGDAERGTGS